MGKSAKKGNRRRRTGDDKKWFEEALQLHRAGKCEPAKRLYEKIIRSQPSHPDAHYLLGLIAKDGGDLENAVQLMQRAITLYAGNPAYHNSLGSVLQEMGDLPQALRAFQNALEVSPDYLDAWVNLGNTYGDQGEHGQAIGAYLKALELSPESPDIYNNLGLACIALKRLTDAADCFQQAIHLDSSFYHAYLNLGNVYREQGKTEDAAICYRTALDLSPGFVGALSNLGNVYLQQGRLADAEQTLEKALALAPRATDVRYNLGNVYQAQGRLEEAMICYREALEISPSFFQAANNLGNILYAMGEYSEAVEFYEIARQIAPGLPEVYFNLGNVFQEQGELTTAVASYAKALDLKQDYIDACSHLLHLYQKICDWRGVAETGAALDRLTRERLKDPGKQAELPFVHLARKADAAEHAAVAASWSRELSCQAEADGGPSFVFNDRPKIPGKLTIGYVSGDFCNHPVASLMRGLYGLHDRNRFRVYCYSIGKDDGSYIGASIRKSCDRFVDLRRLSDRDAARLIYEDGVDILVDLMGHTRRNRLRIFAFRPAPIQVAYLGFLGTTGARFMDYIVTDRMVTPPDQASCYTENFLYLPDCYQINDHEQPIDESEYHRRDFGLPDTGVVFCCFNNPYKIGPRVFDAWMEILKKVPGSVLWLYGPNDTVLQNLIREADGRGIDTNRLIFSGKLPMPAHLARLRLADLGLDTWRYNGGATTSNALWAGVPVVTLMGSHFVSRMAASSLTAVGLPQLVTYDADAYVDQAVYLGNHPDELAEIRKKLLKNRTHTPLFDTPGFVRNLEKGYDLMWQRFVSCAAPAGIDVKSGELITVMSE